MSIRYGSKGCETVMELVKLSTLLGKQLLNIKWIHPFAGFVETAITNLIMSPKAVNESGIGNISFLFSTRIFSSALPMSL